MKAPPQIHLGTFPLGHENVDLYALPNESGGCFYFTPTDTALPRIKIGLDYDRWDQLVSTLLHETFEFAAARASTRFRPCGNLSNNHDAYLFAFNHTQFSELCAAAAAFLTPALPALCKTYRKHRRK